MKKYGKLILLSFGVVAFLTSCECKTCTKSGDSSQQICKEGGSQADYDNAINCAEAIGYTCK